MDTIDSLYEMIKELPSKTMIEEIVTKIVDVSTFGTQQEFLKLYTDFNQSFENNVKTILFNTTERQLILKEFDNLFNNLKEEEYVNILSFSDMAFHSLIQSASTFKKCTKNQMKLFPGTVCINNDLMDWSEWSNNTMCVKNLNSPKQIVILVESVKTSTLEMTPVLATWFTVDDTMTNLTSCQFLIVCRHQNNFNDLINIEMIPKEITARFNICERKIESFGSDKGGILIITVKQYLRNIAKSSGIKITERSPSSKNTRCVTSSPIIFSEITTSTSSDEVMLPLPLECSNNTILSSNSKEISTKSSNLVCFQTDGKPLDSSYSLLQTYSSTSSCIPFLIDDTDKDILVNGELNEFGIPTRDNILKIMNIYGKALLSCTLNFNDIVKNPNCREVAIKTLRNRVEDERNKFPIALNNTKTDIIDNAYMERCIQDLNRYWLEVLIAANYAVKGTRTNGKTKMVEIRDMEDNIIATYDFKDKYNNNRNAFVNQNVLTKLIECFIDVPYEESSDEMNRRFNLMDTIDQKTAGYSAEFKTLMLSLFIYTKTKLEDQNMKCRLFFHAPYNTLNEQRKAFPTRLPFTAFVSPDLKSIIVSYYAHAINEVA